MMRRSTKDIFIVLVSIVVYSLLIVFWPYQSGDAQSNAALACVIHAVLYILVAYAFSSYCGNPHFLKTPLAISCLLVIVYLGVPFLKYYGRTRYIEQDVALYYRLLGLLVICASILVIVKLYAKKWITFHLRSQEAMQRHVGLLFTPLMYSVLGLSTFFLITGNVFGESKLSAAQHTLIISGYFVPLYYFAFFGTQQKAIWNELLFVCSGLAITFYSGQRFAVLLAIFLLVFARIARIRCNKRRKSMVLLGLMSIPLALVMTLGPLTEMTKTRYGGVDLIFELQRTDFADFVGAASTAEHKDSVFAGLHTSLMWAVPGRLIDKEKLNYSMEPFFEKNDWRSADYRDGHSLFNIDYIDSIFAGGAMVGGFAGALLFSLAWYGAFVMVLSQLRSTLLLSFYLGSVPSMFNIEIAFWTVLPTLRNWILMSLLLFGVVQLISFLLPRRRRFLWRRREEEPIVKINHCAM